MLEYHPDALTADEAVRLARHQTEISAKTTYQDQVSATGTWHPSKLGTAKDKLFAARPRNGRYVFCENDTGRDVEHLRPRQLHPDLTYNWDNLIAACGECNGPKGTQDAVLDSSQPGGVRSITREKKKKNEIRKRLKRNKNISSFHIKKGTFFIHMTITRNMDGLKSL